MPAHEIVSNAPAEHTRFLRIRDVMAKTGLSRSHLYHLTAEGKFPKSVLLVVSRQVV
jgi:predicted DNA-binding transcriptional regulator AlpA